MRLTRAVWMTGVQVVAAAALVAVAGAQAAVRPTTLTLAAHGRTPYVIAVAARPSRPESLAASELSRYLKRMSGATFAIVRDSGSANVRTNARVIVLRSALQSETRGAAADAYRIMVRGDSIVLAGESPRAVLYAAYDLLARLGCKWLAPKFAYYDGNAELVPRVQTLEYRATGDVEERPVFAIRKLDMAGARSHDIATLRQIVEWMPKLRFNTLMVSMVSGVGGNKTWDQWRGALTPELERRGITIEVGGHGYQNFLSAKMDKGALFARHPEWFGKDSSCKASAETAVVFNTDNPDAVKYLIGNIVHYVTTHPEIDVFDFWPPDGARWNECASQPAADSVSDRQARLVSELHAALAKARPELRVEMIAYAHAKLPPSKELIPRDVLVDFCPIGEDFDAPIFDSANTNNGIYVRAIRAWRSAFPGDIGLYSYYRKYAWRSLPNVIPHFMQRELQWYASVPLQGISSYAEPGDWYTYELNHYTLGHLAWNPSVNVDSLIDDYALVRYGRTRALATAALSTLENSFRLRGSIPYSGPDSATQIAQALAMIDIQLDGVERARARARRQSSASDLGRLGLMLEFAARDLAIQKARAEHAPPVRVRTMVRELVAFLTAHKSDGVFVVYGGDDFSRYLKHYTRDWQAVGPAAAAGDGE